MIEIYKCCTVHDGVHFVFGVFCYVQHNFNLYGKHRKISIDNKHFFMLDYVLDKPQNVWLLSRLYSLYYVISQTVKLTVNSQHFFY